MLLSFERPTTETPWATLLAVLENCRCEAEARAIDKPFVLQTMSRPLQRAWSSWVSPLTESIEFDSVCDHRQDSKGTWWMPWHLEAMKDVNDCDKPR